MTREELIAAAEALEWAVTATPTKPFGQNAIDCISRAQELRAQAEAMPRIVREGRDFDVKFHDNGAATSRKDGTRSDGKSALESAAAAAPPSAAQPVAWTMSELCRFFAYAYRAGHDDTCEAVYTHVLECDADTYHQDSVVEYLTDNGMSAAPPDLAARVKELEAALQDERYTVANLYERIAALEAELARAKEAVTELRAMEQNTAELHHKTHNDLVAVRAECDTACEELRNLVDRYEERVIERDAARAECERLKREVMILAGMSADAIDAASKEGK